MNTGSKVAEGEAASSAEEACPLDSPLTGRVPGLLALLLLPAVLIINPLFVLLASGMLAVISLLLSPPRCRLLGMAGLLGALTLGALRLL